MIFFCFSKSQKHIGDKGEDKIEKFYENVLTDEALRIFKIVIIDSNCVINIDIIFTFLTEQII